MKSLIAGNWKMHGTSASLAEVATLIELCGGRGPAGRDVLVCPPATLLGSVAERLKATGILAGGQDCHPEPQGAHTGDVSAEMLKDAGAAYVIVGHSERRADHGETDELVLRKAEAAIRAGLVPIICVGETLAARQDGRAGKVVLAQLDGSLPQSRSIVVAYEPVWAIGSGLTPKPEEIAAMHGLIRDRIGPNVRILYGGSVKPANAAEILRLRDVNGALVGGASLKAPEFHAIIEAAP